MNDSCRQSKLHSVRKLAFTLGVAGLFLPLVGCVNGSAFRSAQATGNDTTVMLAETNAIQSDAVESTKVNTVGNSAQTSLVSTTAYSAPSYPTITTLQSSSDLNQRIASAPGRVVLDFYADWCGPCKKQGLILHEVEGAAERTQTTIIKINVDQHRELAKKLNVSGLPTLMLVNDGQLIERQTGLATKERLVSWMR